eukprot:755889-Hanusia_phi.AAC.6
MKVQDPQADVPQEAAVRRPHRHHAVYSWAAGEGADDGERTSNLEVLHLILQRKRVHVILPARGLEMELRRQSLAAGRVDAEVAVHGRAVDGEGNLVVAEALSLIDCQPDRVLERRSENEVVDVSDVAVSDHRDPLVGERGRRVGTLDIRREDYPRVSSVDVLRRRGEYGHDGEEGGGRIEADVCYRPAVVGAHVEGELVGGNLDPIHDHLERSLGDVECDRCSIHASRLHPHSRHAVAVPVVLQSCLRLGGGRVIGMVGVLPVQEEILVDTEHPLLPDDHRDRGTDDRAEREEGRRCQSWLVLLPDSHLRPIASAGKESVGRDLKGAENTKRVVDRLVVLVQDPPLILEDGKVNRNPRRRQSCRPEPDSERRAQKLQCRRKARQGASC